MRDLYDGHNFDLKKNVDTWLKINMVPVEYRTLVQIFHLIVWLFQYVTEN